MRNRFPKITLETRIARYSSSCHRKIVFATFVADELYKFPLVGRGAAEERCFPAVARLLLPTSRDPCRLPGKQFAASAKAARRGENMAARFIRRGNPLVLFALMLTAAYSMNASPARAQVTTSTGSIQGTLVDQKGGALTSAKVTI